jgi:hypothetical protein
VTDKKPWEVYGYEREEWNAAVAEKLFAARAGREAKRVLMEEECPSQPIPPVVGLDELLDEPDEDVHYRVEGWQPFGTKILIVGQGKAGKSHLAHNLIHSLADGSKFLNQFKANAVEGTIALLDFELSRAMGRRWLRKQEIKKRDKVKCWWMRGSASSFNILDPSIRREWAEELAESNVSYVILDCLRPVMDALGLDEHNQAGKFFGAFEALLKDAGIEEAAVVHHMGHGGERSRGDSRIVDWPDASWLLTLENINDQASARFLRAFGREINREESKIIFDPENGHMHITKGSRSNTPALEALKGIEEMLRETGDEMSQLAVLKGMKDTGHSRANILAGLRIGLDQGRLVLSRGERNTMLYSLGGANDSWVAKIGGGHGSIE